MAIVACKECARKVSDKAVCCPHCGVPIAGEAPRRPRRVKRWLYGTLIGVSLAWAVLATLWLTGVLAVPTPLIGVLEIGSRPVRTVTATDKTVLPVPHGVSAPAAVALQPINSAVYRTSVEQLYQDYDANEVAIQSKIGDNPVRISGNVAEIHEDLGHPVVTLHTGRDNAADMVLTDDQRPAAAQLAKDDAVEIQCNRMQRMAARLHGSGCALLLVDAGAKPVYLAVALSGKAGNAPVYVVGPMSRTACVASGDTIALQLTGNSTTDRIRSKSCAATASENLAREGCRLSSTMPAIPDLPSAHLWKYDCVAPDAETLSPKATIAKATSKSVRRRAAEPAAVSAEPAAADAVSPATTASPDPSSGSGAAPAVIPEAVSSAAAAEGPPAPKRESNAGPDGGSPPAVVEAGDAIGTRQLVVADARSTSASPTPSTEAADDLTSVRKRDPQAAERIVTYCSKFTSSATNAAMVAARCRRDEMDAWTRLTVQNEFPNLDDASRRKCSDPPFPNSFVALESCAKYQLHLD
jgi:tRNA_anti-like